MPITFYTLTHASLCPSLRHCEERSLLRIRSKRSQEQLKNERAGTKSCEATWQSPFAKPLTRVFLQLQNQFTANSEQGDCFADAATMNAIIINLFIQLRLAMTNVCGWVRSLQNVDFVGCVLRCMKFERMLTATRLATTNEVDFKRCCGARSAPYTFTARFV